MRSRPGLLGHCPHRAQRGTRAHGGTRARCDGASRAGAPASGGARSPGGEAGFALLATLLVLFGITALSTAGFLLGTSEARVSQNHLFAQRAYYVASRGLSDFIAAAEEPQDTAIYTYPLSGEATVWGVPLVAADPDHMMFLITSVGRFGLADGSAAVRELHTVAIQRDGHIDVKASFTSASGLIKDGGSGVISGVDLCGTDTVAGVAVPPGKYVQSSGDTVPEGDPDVYDAEAAYEQLVDTGIPWQNVVDGSAISPDYTVPPDDWPDFASIPADEWPVILIKEGTYRDLGPGESGRGTIIVEGNLGMHGSFEWNGMLLVGGNVTSDGYQTLRGAIVTGFDVLLGETVPTSSMGNGMKKFLYSSCNVATASKHTFGGLAAEPGTWFEAL